MATTLVRAGSAAPSAPAAPTAAAAPLGLLVVSSHKVRDHAATAPHTWAPYGTQHAWAPGTRQTLCGVWTNGWTVFWDRRFSARPSSACPDCVEATLPEASRSRLDPRADAHAGAGAGTGTGTGVGTDPGAGQTRARQTS